MFFKKKINVTELNNHLALRFQLEVDAKFSNGLITLKQADSLLHFFKSSECQEFYNYFLSNVIPTVIRHEGEKVTEDKFAHIIEAWFIPLWQTIFFSFQFGISLEESFQKVMNESSNMVG